MKNVIHIAFACCEVRHTEGFYLSIVHLQAVKQCVDIVAVTCNTHGERLSVFQHIDKPIVYGTEILVGNVYKCVVFQVHFVVHTVPVTCRCRIVSDNEHVEHVKHQVFVCRKVYQTERFGLTVKQIHSVKRVLCVVKLTCRTVTEI